MATVSNKRSVMTLYSDPADIYSHQVRIVLAEKGVTADIVNCQRNALPEDLLDLNPYGSLPTLVDRELVLYESRIILEYLDERFPHPPLMPVYPIARAECRKMIYRIERDWYNPLAQLDPKNEIKSKEILKNISDTLIGIQAVFSSKPYFMSDEFTLVDCWLAPLLWRAEILDLHIPSDAKPIQQYMKRIFARDSFQVSLSDKEREMIKP